MSSSGQSPPNGELMAATYRRSARFNLLVDMIPARFYMGGDCHKLLADTTTLDPARAKSTSQLVALAAVADGTLGKGAVASASSGGSSRKAKQKSSAGSINGKAPADARSRLELREKLENKIQQLREERRQRQSSVDKAKAANVRNARIAAGEERPSKQKQQQQQNDPRRAKKARVAADGDGGDRDAGEVEAGRLTFDTKTAHLPFEASVGRRGNKVRQLRSALRDEEAGMERLREAEAEGRGEEVRKEIAMKKALLRAKGEKVHDDIPKLRKTQKMMDKKKIKAKESWAERRSVEIKTAEDRQATRKENLQNRRNKKKNKKGRFEDDKNTAAGGGRGGGGAAHTARGSSGGDAFAGRGGRGGGGGRSGFEGKRSNFLNDDK
eukprot:TRINITY_DN23572_c0_g1_i1.p1 TRINITY_DN23572_c0_g1~~TRINITY_DN23572_c0_g1_i1.p1  ORF type:complete len:382 (+),score=101.15 TRINITY_DN23572_c0_g1_i1:104-1249(+)